MILQYLPLCLVGINIAVGKVISQSVPVFLFANIRFVIAAAILVPMVFMQKDRKFSLDPKDWMLLFLQSLFGVFLFSIFMLYGVRYTSAISAGIITSTTPACIALIAIFFLKEKLNLYNSISIALAFLGITLISIDVEGIVSPNSANMFGNALILCAVISEALFTIFAKQVSTKLKPLQMTAIVNVFGFLLFIPFSIYSLMTTRIIITPRIWLLMIYYSLTASIFSFFLWFRGIADVPANIAGLFTVFMPISSAFVGIVFLHESFTTKQAVGMIFSIAAIYLGIRKPKESTSNLSLFD
ncbi:DMT family transporter [Anaerovirgula multivorans]|uniref:DMT family transporter n=1 Tax=Anaerovirgula multivorans TaxID=312168 RepID=UPI000B7815D0|nr:DMT family transporter [Anaerovirgula multivorans]